jgi:hypothetical protein
MLKLRTILLAAPIWAFATGASATPAGVSATTIPQTAVGFWLGVASLVIVGAALLVMGFKSDLLRDGQPTDFGGAKPAKGGPYRRPYSLAQSQMAWWFWLILSSYLYIACTQVPGVSLPNVDGGVIEQTLILMGLGTGTALGAAMIEQVKTPDSGSTQARFQAALAALAINPADPIALATRDQLAPQLASQNFFADVLTDVNGISLHRFQALIWTLVLGGMFIANVLTHTAMPAFSPYLLGLLGISNGVYLGFKVPETPA